MYNPSEHDEADSEDDSDDSDSDEDMPFDVMKSLNA